MTQTQSPYQTNDLLLLIGQCTVELAYLRARVVELEIALKAQLDAQKTSPNGAVEQSVEVIPG